MENRTSSILYLQSIWLCLSHGLAHPVDGFIVIGCLENTRAGNDYFRAGTDDSRDIVGFDPTISFDEDRQVLLVDHFPHLLDLRQDTRNKGLPAKARENGHHQDHIDIGK